MKKIELTTEQIKRIEELLLQHKTVKEISEDIGISYNTLRKRMKELGITPNPSKTHTNETKIKMSKIRKQWLTDNPDSVPCENFKRVLKDENIDFVEEYQPLKERFFSIDIAFPDKMIGIEINGNQHYNRDGTLKLYYRERHRLIEDAGWKLYEISYIHGFDDTKILTIITEVLVNQSKTDFDYVNYIPPKRKTWRDYYTPKHASKSDTENFRKYMESKTIGNYPTDALLLEDVWSASLLTLSKKYGVSDNAIRHRCQRRNIPLPPSGYWAKFRAGKIKECKQIKQDTFNGWAGIVSIF